jgi:hypothetical protein
MTLRVRGALILCEIKLPALFDFLLLYLDQLRYFYMQTNSMSSFEYFLLLSHMEKNA